MMEVLRCIVVLEGEMLPEFFVAIFREFVRRTFAEGRVGKKSSFSLDFHFLVCHLLFSLLLLENFGHSACRVFFLSVLGTP